MTRKSTTGTPTPHDPGLPSLAVPAAISTPWDELVWFESFIPLLSEGRTPIEIAKMYGISRSDVRRTIEKLEQWLGERLVTRRPSEQSTPNEVGHLLSKKIRTLLDARDAIVSRRPVVRVAAIDAAAHFWLPAATQAFLAKYRAKDIELVIRTCEHGQAILEVLRGSVDFGVGTSWGTEPRLSMIPLLDRPHGVVVPKNHTLARRSIIHVDELTNETIIFLHPEIIPWDITDVIPKRKSEGKIILLNNCSQILSWVRCNLGVGIMTEDMVWNQSDVTWKALTARTTIPRAKDAIYLPKDGLGAVKSQAARELIEFLRTCELLKKYHPKTDDIL